MPIIKRPMRYVKSSAADKRGIKIGARRTRMIIPKMTPCQTPPFMCQYSIFSIILTI